MSDVVCAGCGSTQREGAPFCAVCGRQFPRTGRPVEVSPEGPRGAFQQSFGRGDPGEPVAVSTTTEPELMTATQVPAAWHQTPEPALVAPSYAHVGKRFVAFLIDGAGAGLLFGLVYGLGFLFVDLPAGTYYPGDPEFAAALSQMLVVIVLALAVLLAYGLCQLIWEGRSGKTLGHLLLGMRVQSAEGGMPIGVGRAFLRSLVVAAGSLVIGIGQYVVLLSPLWDASGRRQGWHDKAGKAVVVDARTSASAAAARPAAPAAATYPPSVPAAAPVAPAPGPGSVAPTPVRPSPPAQPPTAAGYPPSAAPDPYAAYQAPAPAAGDGLITGVPGVAAESPDDVPAPGPATQAAPAAPAQEPAPAAPAPEPAPAAPAPEPAPVEQPEQPEQPVSLPEEHTSFGATRMQAPVQQQALTPAPVAVVELELESGERQAVDGLARIGRNPEATAGEDVRLIRVDDPTRSVSKNHADLGVDSAGLWLTDRGSTNGTVISSAGLPPRVAEPGARVRVPTGSTIHVGDRRIVVHPGRRP